MEHVMKRFNNDQIDLSQECVTYYEFIIIYEIHNLLSFCLWLLSIFTSLAAMHFIFLEFIESSDQPEGTHQVQIMKIYFNELFVCSFFFLFLSFWRILWFLLTLLFLTFLSIFLQYISLLFIGMLVVISVRGFLTNLMKV